MPRRLILLCTILFSLAGQSLFAQPLHLYTEPNPPHAFRVDNGPLQGMSLDLATALLQRTGHQGTFHLHPWPRAVHLASKDRYSLLLPTIRTAEREFQYQWVGPITEAHFGFYALKTSKLHIEHFEQLKHVGPIAMPREWGSTRYAASLGLYNILEVNDPIQILWMLQQERVRVIGIDHTFFYNQKNTQYGALDMDQLEEIYPLLQGQGYISFHHDAPPELVAQWRHHLHQMRADGSFSRIHKKWLGHLPEPLEH